MTKKLIKNEVPQFSPCKCGRIPALVPFKIRPGWVVICPKCTHETKVYDLAEEAIQAWEKEHRRY